MYISINGIRSTLINEYGYPAHTQPVIISATDHGVYFTIDGELYMFHYKCTSYWQTKYTGLERLEM